jgi:hypothetical protein
MFANPDFFGFNSGAPAPFPKPTVEFVAPEPRDQPAGVTQIYAAAWSMAVRDHELDKLFNAEYYEGGGI